MQKVLHMTFCIKEKTQDLKVKCCILAPTNLKKMEMKLVNTVFVNGLFRNIQYKYNYVHYNSVNIIFKYIYVQPIKRVSSFDLFIKVSY